MINKKRIVLGMSIVLLLAIDLFSKYAWVTAISNKKATTVVNALKEIFNRPDCKAIPSLIQTDNGSEFENDFDALLDTNGKVKLFCPLLKASYCFTIITLG